LLEQNPEKISICNLSSNPSALHLLDHETIAWICLSENPSPDAIKLLEKNPHKINWEWLSRNPSAIHLIEKNLDKIDWHYLSLNPSAIHLLEKNPDKIYWTYLAENPNAIHLLEKNPKMIFWENLSKNPSIFVEDYQSLCKERSEILREELMAKTWHPERFRSWCLDTEDEFYLEI
jgi:ribosomal protein L24E